MGLTEANQVLTLNNLRHQVTLRTDGGIKTGRDVVIAAMMGANVSIYPDIDVFLHFFCIYKFLQ